MKSSKNIPITREYDKQQIINAICAEMTPIEDASYFYKEQQVVVEIKGNVTLIQYVGYVQDGKKKQSKRKQSFQSIKLIFSEKNCKVTLEWPWGTAINDERLKNIGIIIGLIAFILLWIPGINMLLTPIIIVLAILYFIIMLLLDKKGFAEFQEEIYGIIESYM